MKRTCEEIRDRFSALWEDDLSPPEQAEVKRHLDVCSECQKEFARFGKTLRMLHTVQGVGVPERFLSGIYEKIEERRRKNLSSVWTFWKWPPVPNRLKLPIQALAMVAIVFLTLYLTKMMPGDFTRMRGPGEPKSSVLEGQKETAETKASTPEEKRLDQVLVQKQTDKMEKRDVSGSLKEKARTKEAEGELKAMGTETPGASSPGTSKEERVITPKTPTTEANKMDQGLAQPSAPSPATRLKRAEAPQTAAPLKKRETEDVSRVKEAVSPWSEPSEEFVLKIGNEKETLRHLQELVKQFGGETVNAEMNRLLVSLPNSSLAEFRRELEKMSPLTKAQQQESSPKKTESAVAASAGKGRKAEQKDEETKPSEASKEGRTFIRIVLVEE